MPLNFNQLLKQAIVLLGLVTLDASGYKVLKEQAAVEMDLKGVLCSKVSPRFKCNLKITKLGGGCNIKFVKTVTTACLKDCPPVATLALQAHNSCLAGLQKAPKTHLSDSGFSRQLFFPAKDQGL